MTTNVGKVLCVHFSLSSPSGTLGMRLARHLEGTNKKLTRFQSFVGHTDVISPLDVSVSQQRQVCATLEV